MGLALVFSVVVVPLVLVLGGARPASADSVADCSTSVGEIVVVDFSHWGGPVVRGCDATLTTGFHALYAAGFISVGTEEDGPGFICRIGLATRGSASYEPTASEDPCVNTPPATAYWSYWHADAGQNVWTYSQEGPLSYQPPPGSVDAWVFGASNVSGTTGQPSFPPSAVRATNTSPTPSTTTSSVPSTTLGSSTSTSSTSAETTPTSHPGTRTTVGRPGDTTTTAAGHVRGTAATTTTTAAHAPKPTRRSGPGGPQSRSANRSASAGGSSKRIVTIGSAGTGVAQPPGGSAAVFAIGAGAVVVMVTIGALVAWRRRNGREHS